MLGSANVPTVITEDSTLFSDLGFTSVTMLYMAMAIEETFNIEIDNFEVNQFCTVRDVCSYIENAQK